MGSLDDYQFLDSFKRKRIKLTTRLSSFVGVVQRINLNKTLILEQVEELQTGTRLPGAKLFFGHEILNVEFPSSSKAPDLETEQGDASGVGALPVSEYQPYRRRLMEEDEDDEQWVNYVVVDEFHEKFGPALMHIRRQQVIGIGADGVGAFHQERLCWLQVATKNKVYLFDILILGARAFKNGLSAILDSEKILKVVHDCRGIAGCLMAQFEVNLVNVFDTQVADVVHFYNLTGGFLPDRVSTLQEVVSSHLKIPAQSLSSLKIKEQLGMEDKEVWYARPCPAPLLKVMALSVIHLQPLRLVLLDVLMSDYTNLVDCYLRSAQDEPVRTENIGRTLLELPKELRELETIKKARQTQALNYYQVTQDGLLKRHGANSGSDPDLQKRAPNPDLDGPSEHGGHFFTSLGSGSVSESFPITTAGPGRLDRHHANQGSELGLQNPKLDGPPGQSLGRLRLPEGKEITSATAAVPGLGRGLTLPVPAVVPVQGSAPHKTEDMEGVAQRNLLMPGTHPFPTIGRGLFQRPL
ncbi:piRNA biogenesis protein EXD1 [Trichomycterus rosablanca]|uniref:piRNA biogenesis protein EXD1 n=1 Tax=Trichomycterus rosablanca TaxID=2290929 RepID=UPI002F359E08